MRRYPKSLSCTGQRAVCEQLTERLEKWAAWDREQPQDWQQEPFDELAMARLLMWGFLRPEEAELEARLRRTMPEHCKVRMEAMDRAYAERDAEVAAHRAKWEAVEREKAEAQSRESRDDPPSLKLRRTGGTEGLKSRGS